MNDLQGSITALLKQNGAVSERFSYDAWGRRRNPANWNDYNVKAPRLISRGYTGHEHLDGFGLINMNGRMYDPVIGRVLSPDKVVQAPGYTQSFNRYSYCMNNPLRYNDPSGWYIADGTSFGRDIIDLRGMTYYDYGLGNPGNYYSGRGANTTIGPQGYRYVGGGVYLDIATVHQVDFSTVYDNSIAPYAYSDPALLAKWREDYHKQKAYEDKQALAAARNIGYGISFIDPVGATDEITQKRMDLANSAYKYWKSDGWKNCSQFVYDMLKENGMEPANKLLLAGVWADLSIDKPGWRILTSDETPSKGDIIAAAYSFPGGATGHMGIMINSLMMIYAGGASGKVDISRVKQMPDYLNWVYYRYIGK
jgi:RHS repeat-associated protein